jgi:hypothetical protein
MKITKKQQEFIKDATTSSDVYEEWRVSIKLMFPKLFKEEEYKVNDWVYWSGNNPGYGFMRGKCPSFSDSLDICLIEDTEKVTSCAKSNLRPATDKEVETALIKEAKKRGFKEGVYFNLIRGCIGSKNEDKITSSFKLKNQKSQHRLIWDSLGSCYTVFKAGRWATILPNKKKMSLGEIESALGYEVEIISK